MVLNGIVLAWRISENSIEIFDLLYIPENA